MPRSLLGRRVPGGVAAQARRRRRRATAPPRPPVHGVSPGARGASARPFNVAVEQLVVDHQGGMIVLRRGGAFAERLVCGAAHDQQVGDEQVRRGAEREAALRGGEGGPRIARVELDAGETEVGVLEDAAAIVRGSPAGRGRIDDAAQGVARAGRSPASRRWSASACRRAASATQGSPPARARGYSRSRTVRPATAPGDGARRRRPSWRASAMAAQALVILAPVGAHLRIERGEGGARPAAAARGLRLRGEQIRVGAGGRFAAGGAACRPSGRREQQPGGGRRGRDQRGRDPERGLAVGLGAGARRARGGPAPPRLARVPAGPRAARAPGAAAPPSRARRRARARRRRRAPSFRARRPAPAPPRARRPPQLFFRCEALRLLASCRHRDAIRGGRAGGDGRLPALAKRAQRAQQQARRTSRS